VAPNTADPLIRLAPLLPEHLAPCLALDQAALGGLWSEAQWCSELADLKRPGLGLWRADQLVALACGLLVLDELQITTVAVSPGLRRQGLGRQVLQALLSEARSQGACQATLEVASDNAAALALYGQLGFSTAGIRRGYYRNGSDALIQWVEIRD